MMNEIEQQPIATIVKKQPIATIVEQNGNINYAFERQQSYKITLSYPYNLLNTRIRVRSDYPETFSEVIKNDLENYRGNSQELVKRLIEEQYTRGHNLMLALIAKDQIAIKKAELRFIASSIIVQYYQYRAPDSKIHIVEQVVSEIESFNQLYDELFCGLPYSFEDDVLQYCHEQKPLSKMELRADFIKESIKTVLRSEKQHEQNKQEIKPVSCYDYEITAECDMLNICISINGDALRTSEEFLQSDLFGKIRTRQDRKFTANLVKNLFKFAELVLESENSAQPRLYFMAIAILVELYLHRKDPKVHMKEDYFRQTCGQIYSEFFPIFCDYYDFDDVYYIVEVIRSETRA
jgi:hypothetical protein